jgi:hypothetical protein
MNLGLLMALAHVSKVQKVVNEAQRVLFKALKVALYRTLRVAFSFGDFPKHVADPTNCNDRARKYLLGLLFIEYLSGCIIRIVEALHQTLQRLPVISLSLIEVTRAEISFEVDVPQIEIAVTVQWLEFYGILIGSHSV